MIEVDDESSNITQGEPFIVLFRTEDVETDVRGIVDTTTGDTLWLEQVDLMTFGCTAFS